MESDRPDNTSVKTRIDWVDHAKGICIFFVVMFHVNDFTQERAHAVGWLEHVVRFAQPFRMPDFFLIAGLFLASALRKPWRHYLDRKVIHFFYFYALWMTLEYAVLDLRHVLRDDGASGAVLTYFGRFLDPAGPLWFIHLLPIFFLITRLTRSVPPWIVWLAAATLHSLQLKTGYHVPDELGARFVYFYSGYILAPHIFRIARWAYDRLPVALGYLAAWAAINGLVVAAGYSKLPGISLALGYAGALAVILAATLLSKLPWTRSLRYLGQNSIVVYLGDVGVSLIVVRLLEPLIPDVGTRALLATFVTVLGTIVVWRVALRTPARFMYVRPRALKLVDDDPVRDSGASPAPARQIDAA